MKSGPSNAVKARYYSSVTLLYAVALLLGWYIYSPSPLPAHHVPVASASPRLVAASKPIKIISGKPVRIVIPYLALDLPIVDGYYNPKDGTWTLSNSRVQFAVSSSLANDYAGNTFIYGHDTKYLFGHLKYLQPGASATVYTDSGYTFYYTFQGSSEVVPTDTSILDYQGTPIMTIQTCSGSWFEKRQLFRFTFDKAAAQ